MRIATGLCALALLGATCRGTGGPGRGIDFSQKALAGLPPTAQQAVRDAAALLPCSCGCGHTLDTCLATHEGCAHAPRTLALVAALARQGATAAEIILEAQQYYHSFAQAPVPIELAQAPCLGPADAPVTVVVFSDFECPACSGARPLLEALAAPSGSARLCFKYFPLDSHAHSRLTAQSAEFAREQGSFWPLHDALFDHQESLELDDVLRLAAGVGLDAAALRLALEQDRYLARVNGSKAEGKAIGVTGTPTVFFNGHPFTLPLDGPFLSRAVEDHREYARGAFSHD